MILIAMVTDPIVCGRISAKWQKDLFRSKWANLVARWCNEYYTKYGKAPGKHITPIYRAWARKTKDKDTIALVERLLAGLSGDYADQAEDVNSDYILDKASQHFTEVRLGRLKDTLETYLDTGEIAKAEQQVLGFDNVKIGQGEFIDVLHAKEEWKAAFAETGESIIRYPGPIGKFFGNQLGRDCFVALLGREKIGKSLWLMELAFKAVTQRLRVAFFEAGDMSMRQIMRRMATRIALHPRYPTTLKWPVAISRRKSGKVKVLTRDKVYRKALSWRMTVRACRHMRLEKIRSHGSYLRLMCYPNDTLHIKTIESTLREWERDGWAPDILVIDYADILDMTWPKLEGRDRINKTWMQMRKLSQQFHCLLLTASQASARSYDATTLGKGHFSDDKRKHAHVTAMYGINQTPDEKEKGVFRLNCIELRDGEYKEGQCVYVAGLPAIGNLTIRSVM